MKLAKKRNPTFVLYAVFCRTHGIHFSEFVNTNMKWNTKCKFWSWNS